MSGDGLVLRDERERDGRGDHEHGSHHEPLQPKRQRNSAPEFPPVNRRLSMARLERRFVLTADAQQPGARPITGVRSEEFRFILVREPETSFSMARRDISSL